MNDMAGNGMAAEDVKSDSDARARLQSIIAMQMDGRVQEAHDAYVGYFEENDINYPALNMFGICCMALGRFEKASGLFQHIVQNAPMIDEAALYLAECHIELHQADAALAILQPLCKTATDDHKPHILAARAHILKKDHDTAIMCLETACELASDANDILLLVATLHLACKNEEAALEIYGRVLFQDPQNIDALLGQSEALVGRKSWDIILANSHNVIARHPDHQRARFLHCLALFNLKKFEELLASAKVMAAAAPENPRALEVLSQAYIENGDNHAALMAGKHLLELEPDLLVAHQVVACAYFRLGQYEQSIRANEALLRSHPNNIGATENLGVSLERMCRLDEAIAAFDRVMAAQPDRQSVKFNKSISLLLKGELKEGLNLYESRFNPEQDMVPFYLGDEPIWDGVSSIKGKHLLVHPEQGLGDTIMCCRFIQFLKDQGARLTFAVQPALASIMETLDSSAEHITVGDDLKGIDLHVPLMSLAHITYDQWAHGRTQDPYLQVPDDAHNVWAERLGSSSKLRVGFVCSGNPNHSNDTQRSLNMATLVDSLPVGPEYHLLQKDLRDTDKAAIKHRQDITRHDHDIADFADTAALCSHMDLVASVDTSVAHLAGAIGKRTLLMLSWWPDWRWGLDSRSNVWYPNMVSLRQKKTGDWSHVLDQLAGEISQEMARKT